MQVAVIIEARYPVDYAFAPGTLAENGQPSARHRRMNGVRPPA